MRRTVLHDRLFRVAVAAGSVLLLLAFVILRYEGFFAMLRRILRACRPLLLAVLFASMLSPAYERLRGDFSAFQQRHGRDPAAKWIPIAAVTGAVLPPLLVLASVICVLIPQLRNSVELLTGNLGDYSGNFLQWFRALPQFLRVNGLPEERVEDLLGAVQERIPALLHKTYAYTAELLHWVLDIGLGAVLSLYLLTDKPRLRSQLASLCGLTMPPSALRRWAKRARLTCETFAQFLASQLKESLILGVMCWAGMVLFRFPYPVLISVLIGMTNIVPYLGPLIGTVPCVLLLLLVKPGAVLWFLLYTVVLQQVESNLIYPRVVGQSVGLPPAWVLGAIVLCGGLFGAVGMLLGVPLAAVAYAVLFPDADEPGNEDSVS